MSGPRLNHYTFVMMTNMNKTKKNRLMLKSLRSLLSKKLHSTFAEKISRVFSKGRGKERVQ
jgi:hypothetical protein